MGDLALDIDRVLARVRVVSDAELARYERRRERERREELLRTSGVAEVLSAHGLDAVVRDRCEPTRALELVQQWLASPWPVMLLCGPPGTGKTVAAAWALAARPGRYVELERLCQLRRERYGDPGETYWRCLQAEMLVVDELGAEEDRARGVATLHEVIDRRQRCPRRTMLLGNLDASQLRARYDERTLDRLREVAVIRAVTGTSMRPRARKEVFGS